jgi:hypothetical protein
VIEMYRRINTEGTPHSPEDLERALSVLAQGCSEVAQREPQDDAETHDRLEHEVALDVGHG